MIKVSLLSSLCLLLLFNAKTHAHRGLTGIRQPLSSTDTTHHDSLKLFYYGYANFFALYTRMQEAYPDYLASHRNVSFAPYPDPSLVNRNAEQPLFFLALEMHKKDVIAKLQINLVHSFSGFEADWAKNLVFRMPPSFEMTKYTSKGTFGITAGNCTGKTFMSTLTLSGQSLVNHPFDRLPWDWHPNPFDKYQEIYQSTENPLKVIGLNATQGFLFSTDQLFQNFSAKVFYGRTNFTATVPQVYQQLPSQVLAGKVGYSNSRLSIGFNTYSRSVLPDHKALKELTTSISSLDYKVRIAQKVDWSGEIALSQSQTSTSSDQTAAFFTEVKHNKINDKYLIQLKLYYIPYEFVGLDNAVLNTNTHHSLSGLPNDHQYNITLFVNPLQAPDVMANNRKGVSNRIGNTKGKIRFDLEQGYSQEIAHHQDSLTFFHSNASFTRSRFRPWLQGSGPYQRIGGRYRYTTETIAVSSENNFQFYTALLRIKYKTLLLKKEWVILFSPAYSTGGNQLFSTSALNVYQADVFSVYRLNQKVNLLAFCGFQQNTCASLASLPLKQLSLAGGIGFDIQIGKNAGCYLRYKRFAHSDHYYDQDHFEGDEITTELKIFF